MNRIICFIENFNKFIRIKCKILFWKIKYGKRVKIGKNLRFRKSLIINISRDGYLQIGDNCFFNNYCSINCHKKIIIGDDNIFGESVKIYDHNHAFNDGGRIDKNLFKSRSIEIGEGNWIASGVIMLSKTKIGGSNVIGAGSVINQQIGSDCTVFNNRGLIVRENKSKK